jgi:hypothetical protein
MMRPRILALVRLNCILFLMSTFLLQLLAALTTLPLRRPEVQRTFLAIFLPLRAHTILASTTIFILANVLEDSQVNQLN